MKGEERAPFLEGPAHKGTLEDLEIRLLLEAVHQVYGYDFRGYAPASLKRRILDFRTNEQLPTVTGLTDRLLHDAGCMDRFLGSACVGSSTMFRDPEIFEALRDKVVPRLRTYPFLKIWHAGCSTGEEVYSMAIFLHEQGLLEKTRIYATDLSARSLAKARRRVFPIESLRGYTQNYQRAGGTASLSDYYTAHYDRAIFHPHLVKNVVWGQHNLVTDTRFNSFHLVVCRNVIIYFGTALQRRVHSLLLQSLEHLGVLLLGRHENLKFTGAESYYKAVDEQLNIYQKVGHYEY